jgi:hypothetical protein
MLGPGGPSIAPGKLLRALLLQVLYGLHKRRLLMVELQHNPLFRWCIRPRSGCARVGYRSDTFLKLHAPEVEAEQGKGLVEKMLPALDNTFSMVFMGRGVPSINLLSGFSSASFQF